QNNLNSETSDIIATFVYETGILEGQYSFSTAVGLFESAINIVILVTANYLARKISDNSLWKGGEKVSDKPFDVLNKTLVGIIVLIIVYQLLLVNRKSVG